ncbi:MAG: ATP-binding protein [Thermodesulfovibrionales bacterium]|nr:ATP-binding protein [Thermodesulfovibrionales bacterium]
MVAEKRLSLSFPPDFRNIDEARTKLEGFCRDIYNEPFSESKMSEFLIAATEMMNNAAEHSNAGTIGIELRAGEKEVIFRVTTEGERFDPTEKDISMPNLDGELPEGGFGLALIKELTDGMWYEYSDGKNILTIKKIIN